jgi:glutamate-1-semialdehyde aminotransferase
VTAASVIIDRGRIATLASAERAIFTAAHPRCAAAFGRARDSLPDGVPMNWMVKWAGPFPPYAASARDATVTCLDGVEFVDFALGDTGAMAGHAPPATVAAVRAQLERGITHMLPTEDAAVVAEEVSGRFGLPFWQFTLSATDANRFAIRLARRISGRPLVLVHEHNYHGSVDETFATVGADGRVTASRGSIGPPVDPALTTRVVEINDLAATERALADGRVAAMLIEPALTNVGIVLPDPDYHEAVRSLTRRYGTLLIIDETHTLCAGPGGYTRAHGLEPDLLTIGKSIGGGIPVGAYGMTSEVADRVGGSIELEDADVGGVGGTLAGYAVSMAAVRATLGEVLTDAAFERMTALAERWTAGVADAIADFGVPWHVTRLGARAEYHFMPEPPRNGSEQWAHADFELERLLHLWAMNRGVLMTPFHNMALMSPVTTTADVDRHTAVFREGLAALVG